MNNEILNLIKNSNNLSLEEFCKESLKYLNKAKDKDVKLIKKGAKDSDNENLSFFLKLLLKLNDKNLLADLQGLLSLDTIIFSEEYKHDHYVKTFEEDGYIECPNIKESKYEMIPIDSVQIISPLQESEMIVTTTKFDGSYFILYHDGGIETLLTTSHNNFIKSLYILNLMILNEELFKNTLDILVKHENEEIEHVLRCVNSIVFYADNIIDEVKNVKDIKSLNDYYWNKR